MDIISSIIDIADIHAHKSMKTWINFSRLPGVDVPIERITTTGLTGSTLIATSVFLRQIGHSDGCAEDQNS
jgi:hypothetical protein